MGNQDSPDKPLETSAERQRETDEEWSKFLDAAIHDLRAPVRGVATLAQVLQQTKEDRLDEEGQQLLTLIREGATHLDLILKGMSSYSAVVQTPADLKDRVNMNLLLKMITLEMQARIQAADATILYSGLPTVKGDRQALKVLLQNLIDNGLVYRGSNAPGLNISAERTTEDTWKFAVQDNGMGIDPKYQQQIFQPFKRLHGKEFPGVGLGLAISERVVGIHHGRLWVESAIGHGSTFFFTLPVAD